MPFKIRCDYLNNSTESIKNVEKKYLEKWTISVLQYFVYDFIIIFVLP